MELNDLIKLISDITKIDAEEIGKETSLFDDLSMDSLEVLKLITEIETRLDFIVEDDLFDDVSTVEELFNYISSR